MNRFIAGIVFLAAIVCCPVAVAQTGKPTIVLVHGAFADASSWNGVAAIVRKHGYRVVAVANPLRGVGSDAGYLGDIVDSIDTPVVLVGHSYGGLVIGETAGPGRNIKGLVFVAAFAAETGETAAGLSGKFPGSSLGAALAPPVALATGDKDLYIRQDKFHDQFAADVAEADAMLMAVSQRPVTEAALNEPARASAWKQIPSWFVYGDKDKNIPSAALGFMADRAKSRKTVVVPGASHVVMVSHPDAVAELVLAAARSN
ncbi:alpha/beta hydrolase [Lysobacter sp. Root690]|uniref:alpha/beta fold hydrolase n=1 Tax=Lysobacter sp. Root690 TaxID=1736588 RepID=UPI00070177E5|nr:alpha/beta hydrolase [Lysobacter sp. Root690]KRB08297.1 alpha/beta hydrolase [Lysobacter sp. Root690]